MLKLILKNQSKLVISAMAALVLSMTLAACGKSGPLYMPGTKSPYGPPNYSIWHSADYYQQKAAAQNQPKMSEAPQKTSGNDNKTATGQSPKTTPTSGTAATGNQDLPPMKPLPNSDDGQ